MTTPNPYPFVNVVSPPAKPSTIVTRYGVDFCTICSLMVAYCRCGTTPAADEAAQDGAESNLVRRVREARGGR